jgi:hypothetical protein
MIDKKDIELIDLYIKGDLRNGELDSFKKRVSGDPEFAAEVEMMKKISEGLKEYGRMELKSKLKGIASKERSKPLKKIVYWSIAASLIILVGLSTYFYFFTAKTNEKTFAFNTVTPPFKNADIKFNEYQVETDKGAVLYYPSGTIITIPKDAFVDSEGKPVKGNVSVKYREMQTPEDLFISGIPMTYDSAGTLLNMQTAGVCEFEAFKGDTAININSGNSINIDFSSPVENSGYSLLLFDSVLKNWIKIEDSTSVVNLDDYAENTVFIPRKADHSKPRFKLEYRDPSKFPEFEIYKNYSFEVSDNEKNYDPKESLIEWKSISIKKDESTGEYLVSFINPDRQVTYRTWAVFEDADYQVALAIYDQQSAVKDTAASDDAGRILKLQKDKDCIASNTFRPFTISKTGLWSYSKIIKNVFSASIDADFRDMNGNSLDLKYVAILDKTQNTVLRYIPASFTHISFDTASQNIMVAVTQSGDFAYLKKDELAKLPETGKCTVTLQLAPKKPESADDITALIS